MRTAESTWLYLSSLAWLVAACQTPAPRPAPAPLHAPELAITTQQFAGSLLSGTRILEDPQATAIADSEEEPTSDQAVLVNCSLIYLEDSPLLGLKPLASQTDLVADLRGPRPVLSGVGLGADAEVLSGAEAASFLTSLRADQHGGRLVLANETIALPPGTTYALDAVGHERVRDPLDFLNEFPDRGPIPRRVGLRVEHPTKDGPLRLALVLQNLDPEIEAGRLAAVAEAEPQPPAPPGPAEDEDVRMELLRLMQGYEPQDGPLVLLVPSPFRGGNGLAFAIALEPDLAATEDTRQTALNQAEQALHESSQLADLAPPTEEQARAIETEAALISLSQAAQRSALMLLAQRARAALASDLVLTASQEQLQNICDKFFDGQSPTEVAQDPNAVPLRLERAAYRLLLEEAAGESLSPDMHSLLYMRTGALGPFPDAIEGILQQTNDLAGLEQALINENRSFLEDSDTSARLRAHDWLQARGLAVPGYDPLAERKQRRAALEAKPTEPKEESDA